MGKIDYESIYNKNKEGWKDLTDNPQKYEELLAGHYSESNHFVYELLQNAEDERASKVLIEYKNYELIFYHNGDPFDYEDVKGVSSMLMGTKDKSDGQQIGRFGMGFKSVFKYTDEPYIYSDEESFKIERYLLPVEVEDKWDYQQVKEKLRIKLNDGKFYRPFKEENHLTKIVIPFKKKNKNGVEKHVDGSEVLAKLKNLSGDLLLFLNYIKEILWYDRNSGEYARITISAVENDNNMYTCRIDGTALHGKERIGRYLKYKRVFDHSEMTSAEVSVAYSLNGPCTRVNAIEELIPVWVYFPTREWTHLPFLVHGSFQTAVSREKLITPSKFNDYLKNELSDLIAESLEDLAQRKMVTQDFIRTVLMRAFEDEEQSQTIPGFKKRISTAFRTKALLPDLDMNYHMLSELEIAIPFDIADFRNTPMFSKTFTHGRRFVAFNNEQQKYFGAYYTWLKDDLHIKAFKFSDWAKNMLPISDVRIDADSKLTSVDKFYTFLSNYRESLYDSGKSYSKYGSYGMAIKQDLTTAWKTLKSMPIVLNENRQFVPAYINDEQNVYLTSSSVYQRQNAASIVHKAFQVKYELLFTEGLEVTQFDNYQYVKEKVLRKYINIDETINFDNEDFDQEHIEDIEQILSLLDEMHNDEEVAKLVSEASIIKVLDEDEYANIFALPNTVYVPTSDEGLDLSNYFDCIKVKISSSKTEYLHQIDYDYYVSHGIQVSKLKRLGIITSPIIDGQREDLTGKGAGYWKALGEFCPNINILGLYENIAFIEHNEDDELAYIKSSQLLKLLLSNVSKLKGKIRKNKTKSYDEECVASIIDNYYDALYFMPKNGFNTNIYSRKWVFDKGGDIRSPKELSRHDINPKIYKGIDAYKAAFSVLGFIEKDEDKQLEAIEVVYSLGKKDKKKLLKQLAKELGYDLNEKTSNEQEAIFDPDNYISDEFPINRVKNMDMLIRHIRSEFFCADPVKYEKVYIHLKTSYNSKIGREYALGMYTNENGFNVCQICKDSLSPKHVEAIEITNLGIEMPQLRLCLCKKCASDYKEIRDRNKEKFRAEISKSVMEIDTKGEMAEYEIKLSDNVTLHFTQKHIVEIKEIVTLIRKYGVPSSDSEKEFSEKVSILHIAEESTKKTPQQNVIVGSNHQITLDNYIQDEGERAREERKIQRRLERELQMQQNVEAVEKKTQESKKVGIVVEKGKKVSYRCINDGESKTVIIDPQYVLHKKMIGKMVGEIVTDIKGKKYVITSIF